MTLAIWQNKHKWKAYILLLHTVVFLLSYPGHWTVLPSSAASSADTQSYIFRLLPVRPIVLRTLVSLLPNVTAFQLHMGRSLKKFPMHEMLCNACFVGGCFALRQSGQLWEWGGVCSAAGCLVTELSQLTGACNSWHSSAQASREKLHHQPLSGQYGYRQLFHLVDIGP